LNFNPVSRKQVIYQMLKNRMNDGTPIMVKAQNTCGAKRHFLGHISPKKSTNFLAILLRPFNRCGVSPSGGIRFHLQAKHLHRIRAYHMNSPKAKMEFHAPPSSFFLADLATLKTRCFLAKS
jgi:hypothetical protein